MTLLCVHYLTSLHLTSSLLLLHLRHSQIRRLEIDAPRLHELRQRKAAMLDIQIRAKQVE